MSFQTALVLPCHPGPVCLWRPYLGHVATDNIALWNILTVTNDSLNACTSKRLESLELDCWPLALACISANYTSLMKHLNANSCKPSYKQWFRLISHFVHWNVLQCSVLPASQRQTGSLYPGGSRNRHCPLQELLAAEALRLGTQRLVVCIV